MSGEIVVTQEVSELINEKLDFIFRTFCIIPDLILDSYNQLSNILAPMQVCSQLVVYCCSYCCYLLLFIVIVVVIYYSYCCHK